MSAVGTPAEADAQPFDVCGALPTGVTVLEASAGTGKTYAIASLAARYVAEGTPLERVLLVSFTRMATGELRERVRERLLAVRRGLSAALASPVPPLSRPSSPPRPPPPSDDPLVTLLAQGPPQLVREREQHLTRALSNFDAATITTTHGFCQEVLGGLGIAADLEPGVEFVEALDDLMEEVLDDLYVRRFAVPHAGDGAEKLTWGQAVAVARIAVANPDSPISEAMSPEGRMRVRLADRVRRELESRKRRLAVMSFDDLLTRLDAVLSDPAAVLTRRRLRSAYDVVLVDEFQDTDPVQWRIMRTAFGDTGATLVLIADPKQAIYSFRGADVYAYLQAAAAAEVHATLPINRRSDQGLLDAYDALFADAKLGHEGIVYRRARAAPEGQRPRLLGAPVNAPLRIRMVERESVTLTPSGFTEAPSARELISRDLAADLVRLLNSGARIVCGPGGAERELCPGDVAVLVARNAQADPVSRALEDVGVPAVTGGAGSVFGTPPARSWLTLLEALERPASTLRAHAAALTPFFGLTASQVAADDEPRWESLHRRLHDLTRVLRSEGVASLFELLSRREDLGARLLARSGGERELTDLRHVAQLLHAAARDEELGLTALTGWLRRRIAEAGAEHRDEDRSRRLESDAEAVQVLTIHRSKGLEFPIVLLPFPWDARKPDTDQPVTFHDEHTGQRMIDVAVGDPGFSGHRAQSVAEERGQDLRLLYVALTRARHQAVLWWAGSFFSRLSALHRLLFDRAPDGTVSAAGRAVPSDAAARVRFTALAETAPGCISVETARLEGLPASFSAPLRAAAELGVSAFERTLDLRWRRTSYTDITAPAHESGDPELTAVASEPEERGVEDAVPGWVPVDGSPAPAVTDGLWARPSPMGELPAGAAVGVLVHAMLEAADFSAQDLQVELAEALRRARSGREVDFGDRAALVSGLRAAIETPLGPGIGALRLCDIRRGDRLDELAFELPLAGGDRPHGALTPALIADALEEHLPGGDPVRAYASRLREDDLRPRVRGYLSGFLDLVARIPDSIGPRFLIVDYKTNRLAPPDEPLRLWHYRPEALLEEMERRHYLLQALLYVVALHRFLRWRLRDYDPERHLAGVAYAFLRGMTGAEAKASSDAGTGVFAWCPPAALVHGLSEALDRGGRPD